MDNSKPIFPYRRFFLLTGGLIILFLMMEGWFYYLKPSEAHKKQVLEKNLSEAEELFNRTESNLIEKTRELANILETQLARDEEESRLFQTLNQFPSLWGITVFKEKSPLVWKGFSYTNFPGEERPPDQNLSIEIRKQNNVVLLLSHLPFSVTDSLNPVPYHLFTSIRIKQNNALPIGENSEFNLLDQKGDSLNFPVQYSFFDPIPEPPGQFRKLGTVNSDSVGIVYGNINQFNQLLDQWNSIVSFWRSVFSVFAFLLLGAFFFRWGDSLKPVQSLLIQLGIITFLWGFLTYLSIPGRWLSNLIDPQLYSLHGPSYQLLSRFSIHSLFALFGATALYRKRTEIKEELPGYYRFPNLLALAGIFGLVSAVLVYTVINFTYELVISSDLQVMDLQIFPDLSTAILYVSSGILILSAGLVISILASHLFDIRKNRSKTILLFSIIGFLAGWIATQLLFPASLALSWEFILGIVYFGIILAWKKRTHSSSLPESASSIRAVATISLLLSLLGMPILYYGHSARLDEKLLSNSQDFILEEDRTARQITEQILETLERKLRGKSKTDLENNKAQIQSQFVQSIEQSFTSSWRSYSFDLHLIEPGGEAIANYSTDLSSPNWVNVFNLERLSTAIEIEQITKATNRPIVQLPQLANSEDYEIFYRGWIPIYSPQNDDQIAWILCSVYRERPNFDKPIRAVLASLTYDDWKESYLLLHYENGQLNRSLKKGITRQYPIFNRLQQEEANAVNRDSLIYYTSSNESNTYRNLLYRVNSDRVIKASTIVPDLKNILFSFFRFSFSLLLFGFASLLIFISISYWKDFSWKNNKRFEHRILDSFLIATLIFLGLLVITTHYAIKTQNQENVRQELIDKLQGLTNATEMNKQFRSSVGENSSFSLDSLASPLDADATYYVNNRVQESTTPQIYRQHLVPDILPFDVYHSLYIEQKREALSSVQLASQNLLIGYRSVLSPNNDPFATLAIPTFVQSPKYDKQLLETTSYLIVLYLLIFGLFILGTTAISKQLTRPLRYIQSGLNKISEGNLDTTIPVTSNDEIGALAGAYNEMVGRLKELQDELAIAEREAAWKEMAQQVAHEIKNPLTPMKLNVQHLERQLKNNQQDPEKLKEQIQKITANLIEQIQTLNNIASDFSKFSKPIDENFRGVNVNDLLTSIIELYQHDEQVQLETDLADHPLLVKGIPDELRRVGINLVKNSFEAISEDGTVILRSYQKNDSVFIEVEDDGCGIPEEVRSKIFVPNFSTKSSGTGLGLAICKKIIEAHEGSISFASIEGKGTTFIIKLPKPE